MAVVERRNDRRLILLLMAVFSVGVLAGIGATVRVVARVHQPHEAALTDGGPADAVVVLAGASDRLPRGLDLVADGVAPTLVLSVGIDEPRGWAPVADHCPQTRTVDDTGEERGGAARPPETVDDFDVICVVAQTNNTIGEAASITAVAHERGWDSLVLVTSEYHLDRATRYFRTCFDGEILPVASDADLSWPLVRHEMAGYVHARTVGLFCPPVLKPPSPAS